METLQNTGKTDQKKNPTAHKYSCALCPYSTQRRDHYNAHLTTHSSEKPFKCPECPFRTKRQNDVKHHFKLVHLLKSPSKSDRPFPCPEAGCSYAAKQKGHFNAHLKIHGDKTPKFFCSHPHCNFGTVYERNLLYHARIHTGEKPFVCEFESCSYASATPASFLVHSRTHTKERPFKCPDPNCEYSTTNISALRRHQLTHPPKEGEERPSFKCPICEHSTKDKSALPVHIKTHTLEKLFKCDEPNCNYEAKRNGDLKRHRVVHSDEKPFACSFESCEHRSKTKHDLLKHLKTHSKEKQYKCELCLFRAKTRIVVTTHLKNVHSDLRHFKCKEPNCGYAAKRKTHLKDHVLIHKGEKNFSCPFPECDYKAVTEQRVKQHQNVFHAVEKKFKCEFCGFATKTTGSLIGHVRTHTKEQPFICKEEGCKYRAKQPFALKQHGERHHQGN